MTLVPLQHHLGLNINVSQKMGRSAVPKMRGVMGVCGGSSYADHPTKMLMGYFAGSVDVVLGAVCDEAEGVVGSLIFVCTVSHFGVGGVSRNR